MRLDRWFLLLIYFLLANRPSAANPVPDTSPIPNFWDNLYGTAGEPLTP